MSRRIVQLDETVVNRIAAGEVIHRPANAIKEMLENSLDAGSDSITVTTRGGGLKLLVIQDTGHGIVKDDLPIVCKRFTTSKLRAFEDLQEIQTYGFRGEALASITHVARVTITSRTADQACAYRACYRDGVLVGAGPGKPARAMPCSGLVGTQIKVEDLFYNVATRRKALRNAGEEYRRVLDVVSKYSIHYGGRGVAFACKKHGDRAAGLRTTKAASKLENIASIYGQALARELLPVSSTTPLPRDDEDEDNEDGEQQQGGAAGGGAAGGASTTSSSSSSSSSSTPTGPCLELTGYVSNANYSRRKPEFVLFINGRLVSCSRLRKAVTAIFTEYLPRGAHSFVYLGLTMPARMLDVNVHPTKSEVFFMHEEAVVLAVTEAVSAALLGANQSRRFMTQTTLAATTSSSSSSGSTGTTFLSANPKMNRKGPRIPVVSAAGAGRQRGGESGTTTSDGVFSLSSLTYGGGAGGGGGRNAVAGNRRGSAAGKRRMDVVEMEPGGAKHAAKKKSVNPSKLCRIDANAPSGALERFLVPQKAADLLGAKNGVAGQRQQQRSKKRARSARSRDDEEHVIDVEAESMASPSSSSSSSSSMAAATGGADESWREGREAGEGEGECLGSPKKKTKRGKAKKQQAAWAPVELTSVHNLIDEVECATHRSLDELMRKAIVVGVVSTDLSLWQGGHKLYMVDHVAVARELAYQLAIARFGSFATFSFDTPVPVRTCVRMALDDPACGWEDSDGSKEEIAKESVPFLLEKAAMLQEYFGITIRPVVAAEEGSSADGQGDEDAMVGVQEKRPVDCEITTMPIIIPGLMPQPEGVPMFLLRLITEVNYREEQACFKCIAWELAQYYAEFDPNDALVNEARELRKADEKADEKETETETETETQGQAAAGAAAAAGGAATGDGEDDHDQSKVLEDIYKGKCRENAGLDLLKRWLVNFIFPAARKYLHPPRSWVAEKTFVEIACLSKLYRIFERC